MKIKFNILLLFVLVAPCCMGQIKLEDVKIDTSITGFRFHFKHKGTVVYNLSGEFDTVNFSYFTFTTWPDSTYKQGLDYFDRAMKMGLANGYVYSDIVKKDTTLNGIKANCLSLTQTKKGTNYFVIIAFYIKDNTLVLFNGIDYTIDGKYMDGFRRTFWGSVL